MGIDKTSSESEPIGVDPAVLKMLADNPAMYTSWPSSCAAMKLDSTTVPSAVVSVNTDHVDVHSLEECICAHELLSCSGSIVYDYDALLFIFMLQTTIPTFRRVLSDMLGYLLPASTLNIDMTRLAADLIKRYLPTDHRYKCVYQSISGYKTQADLIESRQGSVGDIITVSQKACLQYSLPNLLKVVDHLYCRQKHGHGQGHLVDSLPTELILVMPTTDVMTELVSRLRIYILQQGNMRSFCAHVFYLTTAGLQDSDLGRFISDNDDFKRLVSLGHIILHDMTEVLVHCADTIDKVCSSAESAILSPLDWFALKPAMLGLPGLYFDYRWPNIESQRLPQWRTLLFLFGTTTIDNESSETTMSMQQRPFDSRYGWFYEQVVPLVLSQELKVPCCVAVFRNAVYVIVGGRSPRRETFAPYWNSLLRDAASDRNQDYVESCSLPGRNLCARLTCALNRIGAIQTSKVVPPVSLAVRLGKTSKDHKTWIGLTEDHVQVTTTPPISPPPNSKSTVDGNDVYFHMRSRPPKRAREMIKRAREAAIASASVDTEPDTSPVDSSAAVLPSKFGLFSALMSDSDE